LTYLPSEGDVPVPVPHIKPALGQCGEGLVFPDAFFADGGLRMKLLEMKGCVDLFFFGNPCFYGFFDGSG